MPRVSVIIPMHNGSQFVSTAIQSVRNQTLKDLEILLVDDASTDETLKEVEPHLIDPRVRLFRNGCNLGIPTTKNKGLSRASGQYIAFLDQDDIWLPNKLAMQLRYLEDNSKIGLICSGVYFVDQHGWVIGKKVLDIKVSQPPSQVKRLLLGNFITNSSAMVRKSCLDKTGYFNESLRGADDYDLWIRIAENYPIYYLKKILIKKRLHSASFSERHIQAMQEDKLTTIYSAIKRNPHFVGELQNFIANVHRSSAIKYAVCGQSRQAKTHFSLALKSGNRSFLTLGGYFLSFLSPMILSKTVYLGQSMKRRFGFNF
ncbi:MAG: glycosyltransferase family 2 protein [bacterium]